MSVVLRHDCCNGGDILVRGRLMMRWASKTWSVFRRRFAHRITELVAYGRTLCDHLNVFCLQRNGSEKRNGWRRKIGGWRGEWRGGGMNEGVGGWRGGWVWVGE